MTVSANIGKTTCHIDFDNLCGGNNYAALTDNYDKTRIRELVWSISDNSVRKYVVQAITLEHQLRNCNEDDFQNYMKILEQQTILQAEFEQGRTKTCPQPIVEKVKGYNTTEVGVFMYFVCDNMGIYLKNDAYKNCDQKDAIPAIAKAFGYSESSFTDKLNLDFKDSATRKAMEKVGTDLKKFMPKVSEEIYRVLDDTQDDFDEEQRKKKK